MSWLRFAGFTAVEADGFFPQSRSELRELADPTNYTRALNIAGWDASFLRRVLRDMLLIRLAEEAIGSLVESGHARAPCHLGIGQEAIAVGMSTHLRKSDRVFGGHRSHSHYLALGGDLYALLAEVLGKADGASRGMGGSMHLFAGSVGFYGSVPLVAATVPIAVGAGLAAKMDGSGDVAVAYFGDGATEEGVFHESMNLAATFAVPVIFVCENNLFSSHLHIRLRQPSDHIARYAEAHRVANLTVDGNDVLAVACAARQLVERARQGFGPAFLEAVTYRHRGHVGPKDDIDVGVFRSMADLTVWKRRDPISRLREALLDAGLASKSSLESEEAELRESIETACRRAKAASYPPTSALVNSVYNTGASK